MADLSSLPAIPDASVPLLNPNGTMRREWFDYFRALDRLLRQMRPLVETL